MNPENTDNPENAEQSSERSDVSDANPRVESPTPSESSHEGPIAHNENASPEPVTKPAKRALKNILLSLASLVVLLGVGAEAYSIGRSGQKEATPTSAEKTAAATTKQTAKATQSSASFVDSYLDTPEPIMPAPQFFTNPEQFGECGEKYSPDGSNAPCNITYKKIGTTKAGQTIIIVNSGSGTMGETSYTALQTSPNSYRILMNPDGNDLPSTPEAIKYLSETLKPTVTADATTRLKDLQFAEKINLNTVSITTKDGSGYSSYGYPMISGLPSLRGTTFGTLDTSKVTKLPYQGAQSIYQVIVQDSTNYKVEELYATDKNVYAQPYHLASQFVSKEAPDIKWSDGSKNKDTYTYRAPGCGSAAGYQVAKKLTEADLTKFGVGPDGDILYSLPSSSSLFKALFSDYGTGDYLQDAKYKNLTIEQYQARHAVFLAKNGFGELVIYENTNYIGGGGCGKPVVYLYPTTPTLVNVSVAADVQQSEPLYPKGGWKNVLAQPNGQLSYQGRQYPNLYWEGIGKGSYPIVDSGTVVRTKDAPATMRRQLAEQGLNATEIKDFMDFWQARLPRAPYTRLTWFNTQQLDELAPLSINPKPLTTIRVFLDFQGLNQPISLPTQTLTSTPRIGFTAVEWGGLDRSRGISH